VDDQKIALFLSVLGESRLASKLNQLAKSSNMGALDVSMDTERQSQEASMAETGPLLMATYTCVRREVIII